MTERIYAREKQLRVDASTRRMPRVREVRRQLATLGNGQRTVIAGSRVECCARTLPWGETTDGFRVEGGEPLSLVVAADVLVAREAQS